MNEKEEYFGNKKLKSFEKAGTLLVLATLVLYDS
jgi:hypothetical protein